MTSALFSRDGTIIATGHWNGSFALTPVRPDRSRHVTRLIDLPDGGWAAFHGDHRYELNGNSAGRFWWTAGLCRFEPGELDGYGVEAL